MATDPLALLGVDVPSVGAADGATVVCVAVPAVPAPTPLIATTEIEYVAPADNPPIAHEVPVVVQVPEDPPAVAVT
jgi:hypothetical protein